MIIGIDRGDGGWRRGRESPGMRRANPRIQKSQRVSAIFIMEAWAGIEPANTGFADPCLTTWLPRLDAYERHGSYPTKRLSSRLKDEPFSSSPHQRITIPRSPPRRAKGDYFFAISSRGFTVVTSTISIFARRTPNWIASLYSAIQISILYG